MFHIDLVLDTTGQDQNKRKREVTLSSSERENTIGSPYYLTAVNKKFGTSCGNKITPTLITIAVLAALSRYDVLATTIHNRVSGHQNNTSYIVSAIAENNVFAPSEVGTRHSVHQYSVTFSQFRLDIRTANGEYGEHMSTNK